MDKNKTYILASGSPRRIEMMRAHGIEPVIMPASIEENIPMLHGMCETVMFLALKKAQAVCASLEPCEGETPIILAADTIVYKDEIMGKPADRADAFRMISALRNDVHFVVTGCAIVEANAQNTRVFAEITKVFVKDFSDEELNAYLDTDEPYDKAGGYAIQGLFGKYIDHIEGDFDNVVGFPWARIETELSKL